MLRRYFAVIGAVFLVGSKCSAEGAELKNGSDDIARADQLSASELCEADLSCVRAWKEFQKFHERSRSYIEHGEDMESARALAELWIWPQRVELMDRYLGSGAGTTSAARVLPLSWRNTFMAPGMLSAIKSVNVYRVADSWVCVAVRGWTKEPKTRRQIAVTYAVGEKARIIDVKRRHLIPEEAWKMGDVPNDCQ